MRQVHAWQLYEGKRAYTEYTWSSNRCHQSAQSLQRTSDASAAAYQSVPEPLRTSEQHKETHADHTTFIQDSPGKPVPENKWLVHAAGTPTPRVPGENESRWHRGDGQANAQSGKLGPGTTPDPTNNSLNLLDIFPVLFGANGLIQTSSLTTHLDTNLFRSSMPLFQSSPPLQICNARFPSCHNPPDINYAITHYTVTSWIFQLAGGKNLLSHTSM